MFELILEVLAGSVLKVGESFVSKVVEDTADKAINDVEMIKEFKLVLEALQKNLKSLNAELSGRKKRKREVMEWLEEVKSFEKQVDQLAREVESQRLIKRLVDGGKAAKLNEEIEKLVEQSRNFGKLVLDVCGIKGEIFLTEGMVGEGFSKNCEIILKLLETRQVSRIGIYGMGGVGKTTLAKHIHSQLLQQYQGDVYWVTVSQDFIVKKLQDTIARLLGVDLLDEDDEDRRATILHKALSQKENSVLILDDVWEMIDVSKVGCPFTMERCRFIVTTRSVEVCRRIRCQKIIQVEKLCEDEAWKLFNRTLGDEIEIDSGVEEIAKLVANLCGCLPLAIVTMAAAMRGETDIHTWKNALEDLRERVAVEDGKGGEEVFKVLKYSFDRLKMNSRKQSNEFSTLQLCFLYCSLYPEEYEICRDDLVKGFISDGILDKRKRRRAQIDEGHSVLNKLVNMCLLEPRDDFRCLKCVKMHDLVRGMALKIGEEKYMVRAEKYLKEIPYQEEWKNDLEKVSLMNNDIKRIEDGTSPRCPKLSTLLLEYNSFEVIPNSFFTRLNGLHTLNLCWNRNIKMLPDSISDITSLEALLLEGCKQLEYVPYLGKLKALRELNLSYTAIKETPLRVEELLNLKFLTFDERVLIEGLDNMRELEVFRGGLKSVSDFNCFIRSRRYDTSYRIRLGQPISDDNEDDLECYEKELMLWKYDLKDENILGGDIMSLTIKQCEDLSSCFVDVLDNPTSLKSLRILSCRGIECILGRSLPSQISKTLESIELKELEDMKGVVIQKGEIGAAQSLFSSLRKLRIQSCNKMRTVGLPASGVPNLEEIHISWCGEIEEIFEDEGRGFVSLPKLKTLDLYKLPRLRKVGLAAWGVPNLESVTIWSCEEIEEVFKDEGRGSISLPKLKTLSLGYLPRLKCVYKATMI